MSQCVLGHGAVEKVQDLARKLKKSYLPARTVADSSSEIMDPAQLLDDAVLSSAALLPTAACLLIGNPEVLLQPALVSVFHFFLASPMYSLAAIDVSRTSRFVRQNSRAARPAAPSSGAIPETREADTLAASSPTIRGASGDQVGERHAQRSKADSFLHTRDFRRQRQTAARVPPSQEHVPASSNSRKQESFPRRPVGQRATASARAGKDRGTVDGELQGDGAGAQPFPAGVTAGHEARVADNAELFEGPKDRRLSFVGLSSMTEGDIAGPSGAISPGGSINVSTATAAAERLAAATSALPIVYSSEQYSKSATTYDTALFLHPSIAAIQQLQILASWIAREFRARLIQDAEAAAAAELISRHKRLLRKLKRQTSRAGGRRRRENVKSQPGPRKGRGNMSANAPARNARGYSAPCEGALPIPEHAAGIQNLLCILSLLGLVELQGPTKGILVQPAAEIVTSAAFMHVSVEAFTLELVASPAAFVFEASFEATRHSQKLHFRLGSERHVSTRLLRHPSLVAASDNIEDHLVGYFRHLRKHASKRIDTSGNGGLHSPSGEDPLAAFSKSYTQPGADVHRGLDTNAGSCWESASSRLNAPRQRLRGASESDELNRDRLTATVSPTGLFA